MQVGYWPEHNTSPKITDYATIMTMAYRYYLWRCNKYMPNSIHKHLHHQLIADDYDPEDEFLHNAYRLGIEMPEWFPPYREISENE